VIRDADLFHESVDAMVAACSGLGIDVVVGIEARGFIFGGALAYLLGAGFVPVRKQGRLPTRTETASYTLEYGEAVLEVHADAITTGQRVVIVDDLLATGGTASATIALVERLGGTVARLVFLIELAGLGGAAALNGRNHVSLITI
jgi:adenine phosphoribosyltransferase